MSKYLGPVLKKLRALGLPLPRFRNKGNNPPGPCFVARRGRRTQTRSDIPAGGAAPPATPGAASRPLPGVP